MVNQINDIANTQFRNIADSSASKNAKTEQNEQGTQTKSTAIHDEVKLSATAQQLDSIKKIIDETPDVDFDKVNAIKESLNAGKLTIDANALANKMLEIEAL